MLRKVVRVAKLPIIAGFWVAVAGAVYIHMLARPFRSHDDDIVH